MKMNLHLSGGLEQFLNFFAYKEERNIKKTHKIHNNFLYKKMLLIYFADCFRLYAPVVLIRSSQCNLKITSPAEFVIHAMTN